MPKCVIEREISGGHRRTTTRVATTRWVLAVGLLVWTSAPALIAETHRFIPERFYNTFSFAHPPALRIKPGDRVITRTIDAGGVDWDGKTRAPGPNPQTGPFFVEGAEPGDVLVVTIEKIETNRATAYSSSLLAPYAADPAAIAARQDREPRRVNWRIDKAAGRPRSTRPASRPRSRCRCGRCSAAWAWLRRARRRGARRRRAPTAATWTTPG